MSHWVGGRVQPPVLACSALVLLAAEDSVSRSGQYTGIEDLSRPSVCYHINSDILNLLP